MRILGHIFGAALSIIGGLLLVGAFANALWINFFLDEPASERGNGVLGIAVSAVPLVLGLVILSKLQKKGAPTSDDSTGPA